MVAPLLLWQPIRPSLGQVRDLLLACILVPPRKRKYCLLASDEPGGGYEEQPSTALIGNEAILLFGSVWLASATGAPVVC